MYIVRVVCVLCHITLLYWLYTLLYPVYPRRFFFSFLPTFFFLPPPAPPLRRRCLEIFYWGNSFSPPREPPSLSPSPPQCVSRDERKSCC